MRGCVSPNQLLFVALTPAPARYDRLPDSPASSTEHSVNTVDCRSQVLYPISFKVTSSIAKLIDQRQLLNLGGTCNPLGLALMLARTLALEEGANPSLLPRLSSEMNPFQTREPGTEASADPHLRLVLTLTQAFMGKRERRSLGKGL